MIKRCDWCGDDALYIDYHDKQWGRPVYDDQQLFEMLILEGMQAGLNWLTVLKKREAMAQAFYQFDAKKIVRYLPARREALLNNPAIIRNRRKIDSVYSNAKAYLNLMQCEHGFRDFLWQFCGGKPIINRWQTLKQVPAQTESSQAMSKALKKAGFKFVGPTICYAFMQATGMVNDHLIDCVCYEEVTRLGAL